MDVKDSVQRQFGQVAANYSASAVHRSGVDLDQLLEAAQLRGDERVLDAGTGTGHTALAFAARAAEVVAVDLTEAMLEQGRMLAEVRGLHNVRFQAGDVERLPFLASSFDLVVSRYSAHHWPHPAVALREFARVLRPNGMVLLADVVASAEPTSDTFLNAIELLRDPSHVRDHTVAQWESLFATAGLAAQTIFQWDLRLEFSSWVARMATPAPAVAMIVQLMDGAPVEVREGLRIEADHSFSVGGALIQAQRL